MSGQSWEEFLFGPSAEQPRSFLQRVAERKAQREGATPPALATADPDVKAILDFGTNTDSSAYVKKAIEAEAAKLAAMGPNSGRNHQLNTAAFNLRRFIDNGSVDEQTIVDTLMAAAHACGLVAEDGEKQCEASIRSGFRGSQAKVGARPIPDRPANVTEVSRDAIAGTDSQGDSETQLPKLAAWCLTRDDLSELPDPEPLIGDVLDKGTVALLYGRWGSGKSFIAQDWAACVATGKDWQGRPVEQHRVLYLAAEGAHGMKIRAEAWESGWGRQIQGDRFTVLCRPVNLTSYSEVRELAALIEWGGYGFVIVDTLARCMVGADENSAKDCGLVVDAMGRLLERTPDGRGVVLGVHHTGKDGKTFRGSSVFEAGADTVYAVLTEGRALNLNREKRKDGPAADMHSLQIDPVEGTKSCVLSLHRGVEKRQRARSLLSTFLHHFSTTGATKSELRMVSDQSDGTFYRALSDLLESGALVNEGTDKRPFFKAVIR